MVEHLQHKEGMRLLLTPNCSLSWRGNLRVLFALSGLSLVIVTGMIWAGAWVVFPFAGLELTALAAALYYTARQCRVQEVLIICPETLRLEKGRYRKQAEWELPRRSTRVHLDVPRHPLAAPKLYLMYRDTQVPLASFLNLDDTKALVSILERQGLIIEKGRPTLQWWF